MAARKSPLPRLRKMCLALPESTEVEAWGTPTFRVRKKMFAMYAGKLESSGRILTGVWCKANIENQELLVASDPARYFVPPYVGHKGWLGIVLEGEVDWAEVSDLVTDAYRLVAGKRLAAQLDG